MRRTDYALFPTRLLAVQHDDVAAMNRELYEVFTTHPRFRDGFDMHPDSLNLLALADEVPALARLRGLFLGGLRDWLRLEQVSGDFEADVVLFSNLAGPGEMTLAHNHNADVVGVYYVRTAAHDRPVVALPDGPDDYFAAEDGVLVLHDPRFNANLAAVRVGDYAKVFPRPGLMVLFPGYLWHSVTPNLGGSPRLAISANFRLRWPGPSRAQTWPVSVPPEAVPNDER